MFKIIIFNLLKTFFSEYKNECEDNNQSHYLFSAQSGLDAS